MNLGHQHEAMEADLQYLRRRTHAPAGNLVRALGITGWAGWGG